MTDVRDNGTVCPLYTRSIRYNNFNSRIKEPHTDKENIVCDYRDKDVKSYKNYIAINLKNAGMRGSTNKTSIDSACFNARRELYSNLGGTCDYDSTKKLCQCKINGVVQGTFEQNKNMTNKALSDANPLVNKCDEIAVNNSSKGINKNGYYDKKNVSINKEAENNARKLLQNTGQIPTY